MSRCYIVIKNIEYTFDYITGDIDGILQQLDSKELQEDKPNSKEAD